jgi:hypothetical protein
MNRSYYEGVQDFGQPTSHPSSTHGNKNSAPEYPDTSAPVPGTLPMEFQAFRGPRYAEAPSNLPNHRSMSLQLPLQLYHRPRSASPLSDEGDGGYRHRPSLPSPSFSDAQTRSYQGRARDSMNDTFSTSATGLGVGLLGALAGAVIAHEASEVAARCHRRNSAVATIAGAIVGGLGANALEKHSEDARRRETRRELVQSVEQWRSRADGASSGQIRRDNYDDWDRWSARGERSHGERYERYDSDNDNDSYDGTRRHGRRVEYY